MTRLGFAHRFRSDRFAPRRARVGLVEQPVGMDPSGFRDVLRARYNESPGVISLGMVIYTLGGFLLEAREAVREVELVGGGVAQVRAELVRRMEDYESVRQDWYQLLEGNTAGMGPDGETLTLDMIETQVFVRFPQDEGPWEYEDGTSEIPPARGLTWQVGTLLNQVWNAHHPARWIGADPDTPWWEWVPEMLAAGWVEAFNTVQAAVVGRPDIGPGLGAEIGHQAELMEDQLDALANKAGDLLTAVAGAGRTALIVGALFAAFLVFGRGRR
jgi:hypothetical protein